MKTQASHRFDSRVSFRARSRLTPRHTSALALLVAMGITPAALAAGPSAAEWAAAEASFQPLLQGGVSLGDVAGDETTQRDLVGSDTAAVAYLYNDGSWLYARIRVNRSPAGPGGLSSFGWGVLIHNDPSDPCYLQYNYSLMVNGIAEQIEWAQNDTSGIQPPNAYPCGDASTCTACDPALGDPSESSEILLAAYDTDYLDDADGFNVRIVPESTQLFGTDEDYFIDFAIPFSAFTDAGIVASDPLTFWVGSSNNARSINVDLADTDQAPGPGMLTTTATDPTGASGGTTCTDDGDCSGSTPACHPTSRVCVECTATNTDLCTGATTACEVELSRCVPCAESATCSCEPPATICVALDTDSDTIPDREERLAGTDPADADSDNDGVADAAEPSWNADVDGDGLIGALDPDSDNDGLFDGTELGLDCNGPGTDATAGTCTPDADGGATVTDPRLADTDGGGVDDGSEDVNLDGAVDVGELNPNVRDDDADLVDADGDGLSDDLEVFLGSDPSDLDSDDDGLPDGAEPNPGLDSDGDGDINIVDADSDDDGLFDGTEAGRDCASAAAGALTCIPDADPLTTTGVLTADTDRGGTLDGAEDANHNGAVDGGETDPNLTIDDRCASDLDCGSGDSGMVCDVGGTDACVAGCRAEGGNGCPAGETCTSTGPEVGSCVSTGTGGSAGAAGAAGASAGGTAGAPASAGAAGAELGGTAGTGPLAGQGGLAPSAGAAGAGTSAGGTAGAGAPGGGSGGIVRTGIVAKGNGVICAASGPQPAGGGGSWLALLAGLGVLLRRRARRG